MEAASKRDFGQRGIRLHYFPTCSFDAKLAYVFTHGGTVVPAEFAREVDGVDADGLRYLMERQALEGSRVDKFFSLLEPTRGLRSRRASRKA